MRFGLFGSAAARRPGPSEAAEFDSSEGFRDFIEYNVEAEGLGFHGTFVVEHHFTGYGQVSATINLLTWLGARATTLRLGTAVIVLPWHNPGLLAEQAATLDLLSGGRLDFGIGKGYRYNEFAGFCVDMDEADARFNECLDVIVKAWTANEPFSPRGHFWQFDNIAVKQIRGFLGQWGGARRPLQRIPRCHCQGRDRKGAVLASRPLLAVRQHRR